MGLSESFLGFEVLLSVFTVLPGVPRVGVASAADADADVGEEAGVDDGLDEVSPVADCLASSFFNVFWMSEFGLPVFSWFSSDE